MCRYILLQRYDNRRSISNSAGFVSAVSAIDSSRIIVFVGDGRSCRSAVRTKRKVPVRSILSGLRLRASVPVWPGSGGVAVRRILSWLWHQWARTASNSRRRDRCCAVPEDRRAQCGKTGNAPGPHAMVCSQPHRVGLNYFLLRPNRCQASLGGFSGLQDFGLHSVRRSPSCVFASAGLPLCCVRV